jgi:hypothetical protein
MDLIKRVTTNTLSLRLLIACFLAFSFIGAQVQGKTTCDKDSQCATSQHRYDVCDDGECKHKDIFPMYFLEFVGIFSIILIMALTNAGGIGGGSMTLPTYMIFFAFDSHQIVPLANFTNFIAAMTRFLINMKKKHPEKNMVLIEYDTCMVLMPMVLCGTMIGVFVNSILAPEVITILMTLFLFYVLRITINKAMQLWKAETKAK